MNIRFLKHLSVLHLISLGFIFVASFLIIHPKVSAECNTPWNPSQDCVQNNINKDGINASKVTNLAIGNMAGSVNYGLIGEIQPLDENNPNSIFQNKKQGLLFDISRLVDSIYTNPPASGLAYTRDVLAHAGILAKPALAQGIGFSGLSPFLPFWQATRNIAYTIIIIVMVAIGFMIIFRMKMDPKTVITVQAALPKIVLSLILITFSYPIVGFLVDMMYVVMALIIAAMVNGMGGTINPGAFQATATNLQTTYMNSTVTDLLGAVFWSGNSGFATLWPFSTLGTGAVMGIAGLVGGFLTAGTAMVGIFFILLLLIGFLYTFIRLFFLLLNSYIQLLINLILSPIILLGEAIPGRSTFGGWLSTIIGNLSVFPATAAILIFATFLGSQTQLSNEAWSPPFIGLGALGGTGLFHAILAVGIVFIAPSLVVQVKKAFNPQTLLPFGIGTVFSPLTGTVQAGMQGLQSSYYFQSAMHGPVGGFIKSTIPKLFPGGEQGAAHRRGGPSA